MSQGRIALVILVAAVLVSLGMACAPVAAPAPIAAPETKPALAAAPETKPAPTAAPETKPAPTTAETEWDKVVAAAQKEGKLTGYFPSALVGDVGRIVVKAFKEKYGITMEVLVSDMAAITEKLLAEQRMGKYVGDVVQTGSVTAPRQVELGLSQDVSRDLPVLRDREAYSVPPVFSPDGHVLVYEYNRLATVINSKLVKPEEIQSYYDLLNPKWKGAKINTDDPRRGSGAAMLNTVQMRMDKILDDEYFRRLAQQEPLFWVGSSIERVNMVARGEVQVCFECAGSTFLPALREGAPIKVLYLKEGTIAFPMLIMAVNNAPHPNAARLFLNWFLSDEGQKIFHEASQSTPIRKDLPDFLYPKAREFPIKKLLPTTWAHTQ